MVSRRAPVVQGLPRARKILALGVEVGRVAYRWQERSRWLTTDAGEGWVVQAEAVARRLRPVAGPVDEALVLAAVIDKIGRATEGGVRGVVLLSGADHGLDACRVAATVPVVGGLWSALRAAMEMERRFSVISPSREQINGIVRVFRESGVRPRYLASVRSAGLTSPGGCHDPDRAFRRLAEAGRRAVSEDGARTLVLGSTELGVRVRGRLESALGVPVIDPNRAAVSLLQLLI